MTTTALAPSPTSTRPTSQRPLALRQRRTHRLAAGALVLAALSIPVTGTGSALAATHAPAHVRVAAVTDPLVGAVAVGKNDV
jgi:hypothetical protein